MQEQTVVRPKDFGDSSIGKAILLLINLVITAAVWFLLAWYAPDLLHWTNEFSTATELTHTSIKILPVQLVKLKFIVEITVQNLMGWVPITFIGVFFVLSMLDLREGRLKNFIRMVALVVAILIVVVAIGSIFAVQNVALYSTLGDASKYPTFYTLSGAQRFKDIVPANVLETTAYAIVANIGIGLFLTLSCLTIEVVRRQNKQHFKARAYND